LRYHKSMTAVVRVYYGRRTRCITTAIQVVLRSPNKLITT